MRIDSRPSTDALGRSWRAEPVIRQDAMKSAQSMQPELPSIGRLRLRAPWLAIIAALLPALCGCSFKDKLHPPLALASPYDRPQIWAVAPFANESGISIVKTDRIADVFVEQAEEIEGIDTIPVNRVLLGMRRLEMRAVNSPADALALMNVLGVDGLIVGTVSAYDPYPPPKFGAAVQLYRRDSRRSGSRVDPVALTRAPTERVSPGELPTNSPAAQASGVFDARNHQTLMQLEEYARGRTQPGASYGVKVYLVNMELYTQFVAYRLLHDLLDSERARLNPPATQPQKR